MRDSRIDIMRGLAMLMMISDHCAYNVLSAVTLSSAQFCDASEIFFLISGYSCMAAFGRRFDAGRFREGLVGIGKNLMRIYSAQILMMVSCFVLMKTWTHFSTIDFLNVSTLSRGSAHHGVLSSNLFDYHWRNAASLLLVTNAPHYFDVLRTYLVLIAGFPLMWFGMRRAPRITVAASVLLWTQAHGAHALAFLDTATGQGWYFNPFAWQLIFLSGVGLRMIMERRTTLPSSPALTILSLLVVALGLAYHLSGIDVPHLPMFKTNLSPVRMLNAFALIYLALSREWWPWLIATLIVDLLRIVGRNSLAVFVAGMLISLIVDMADVQLGEGTITQMLVVSAGLLTAVGVAHLAERRRPRCRPALSRQMDQVVA